MSTNPYYGQEGHGPYELIGIGDLELEEGGTIPDCQLAVATHGMLNAARDNAILVPTWYSGTSKIMEQVYIGKYCTIECDGRIGRGTIIANQVGLVGRNDHDHRAIGVTMRHAPWIGDAEWNGPRQETLDIGGDVWIGYGAIVLSGVRVGRGSIIAAGSVVTHHVAPYALVAGVPAQVVGRRFTDEEIVAHELALGLREPDDRPG